MAALCNRAGHLYIFILWFLLLYGRPNVIGQTITFSIYFCPVVSFYLFFFPRLISAVGLSANLECMSEMCRTWLAENTGRKKSSFWHHRTTLSGCIFAAEACIDNRKKHVKQRYLPTCPDNMENFGLLTAEICWLVWGTPANFNGFYVLAALLHGTLVVGVSQTLRH